MFATEIQAAQVILEKGSRFEIPAPFFYRLIGKSTLEFEFCKPCAATCLEVIDLRLNMAVTDEEFEHMTIERSLSILKEHGYTISKIVAIVALRGSKSYKLVSEDWLAKQLLKHKSFSWLLEKMHEITLGSGLQDFMIIIGLLKTLRLMKPNNPSQ